MRRNEQGRRISDILMEEKDAKVVENSNMTHQMKVLSQACGGYKKLRNRFLIATAVMFCKVQIRKHTGKLLR